MKLETTDHKWTNILILNKAYTGLTYNFNHVGLTQNIFMLYLASMAQSIFLLPRIIARGINCHRSIKGVCGRGGVRHLIRSRLPN